MYQKKIIQCISGIIEEYEHKDYSDIDFYKYIDETFLKVMFNLHIKGILSYFAISLLFACAIAYTNIIAYNYIGTGNKLSFIIIIISLGTIFGVLWNLYGYYSDSRIDWSKIFISLKNFKISKNDDIRTIKYKAYKISFAIQILIVFLVLGILTFIAYNLNVDIIVLTTLIPYSSVAASFLVVLKIYAGQTYKLFYRMKSNRKNDDVIFPNIFDLTEKKEN